MFGMTKKNPINLFEVDRGIFKMACFSSLLSCGISVNGQGVNLPGAQYEVTDESGYTTRISYSVAPKSDNLVRLAEKFQLVPSGMPHCPAMPTGELPNLQSPTIYYQSLQGLEVNASYLWDEASEILTLPLDCDAGLSVVEVPSAVLASVKHVVLPCYSDQSPVVVKVAGSSVMMKEAVMTGNLLQARSVVLYFPDAQWLSLMDTDLKASIVAPNAQVTGVNSYVSGTIEAKLVMPSILVSDIAFDKSIVVPAVPAPVLDCEQAFATPSQISPVDEQFQLVDIQGLTNHEVYQPKVTVDCVWQDEALDVGALGGDEWDAQLPQMSDLLPQVEIVPEAYLFSEATSSIAGTTVRRVAKRPVVQYVCPAGGVVELRREQVAGGNGRVYSVDFTAVLGAQSCQGRVRVGVDGIVGVEAVDDGAIYESMEDSSGCSDGNGPPRITSTPVTQAIEGDLYTYDVDAVDPDNDTLTFDLIEAPLNMVIDTETGLILWQTGVDDIGDVVVLVGVRDELGEEAVQQFVISVTSNNGAPTFVTLPALQATPGQEYRYDFNAEDPDADPLTYRLLEGPSGLSFDAATQAINWVPEIGQEGKNIVTIEVQDPSGEVDVQSFEVNVLDVNFPPEFITEPVVNAVENVPYTYNFDAIDPDADPLAYVLLDAPEGMVINVASQSLQWTPTEFQVGPNTITLRVVDAGGLDDIQTFVVDVANTNQPPEFTSTPRVTIFDQSLYEYKMDAQDPDNDPLTFELVDGPAGMIVAADGQTLTWQADASQGVEVSTGVRAVSVAVRVVDVFGLEDTQSFSIEIRCNPAITFCGR